MITCGRQGIGRAPGEERRGFGRNAGMPGPRPAAGGGAQGPAQAPEPQKRAPDPAGAAPPAFCPSLRPMAAPAAAADGAGAAPPAFCPSLRYGPPGLGAWMRRARRPRHSAPPSAPSTLSAPRPPRGAVCPAARRLRRGRACSPPPPPILSADSSTRAAPDGRQPSGMRRGGHAGTPGVPAEQGRPIRPAPFLPREPRVPRGAPPSRGIGRRHGAIPPVAMYKGPPSGASRPPRPLLRRRHACAPGCSLFLARGLARFFDLAKRRQAAGNLRIPALLSLPRRKRVGSGLGT